MTDAPKLLDCPFCGGDDITISPLEQDHAQAFCNGCLANGPSADEIGNWTRPHLAWNTRAVPQPPQEPTPEAVERAARVLVSATACDPDKLVTMVQAKPEGGSVVLVNGPFWQEKAALARAVLIAAQKAAPA